MAKNRKRISAHPPTNVGLILAIHIFAESRHGAVWLGTELVRERGRERAGGDKRLPEWRVVVVGDDFAIGVPVVPDVGGGFYLTQSPRSPRRVFITQRRRGSEGIFHFASRSRRSHQLSAHPIHDTIVADILHPRALNIVSLTSGTRYQVYIFIGFMPSLQPTIGKFHQKTAFVK